MYPSITKYQANFESTSSVINYDVSRRFLWSLTFMTIVLTVNQEMIHILLFYLFLLFFRDDRFMRGDLEKQYWKRKCELGIIHLVSLIHYLPFR